MKRPSSTDNELSWSKWIAHRQFAECEVRMPDGSRCDVLTSSYAVEVEWCKKWKESIGQAISYGIMTNRKPKVILLLRGKTTEKVYYARCLAACVYAGVELETVNTR